MNAEIQNPEDKKIDFNNSNENYTICWDCANYSKCSWSRGKPVDGWVAIPATIKAGSKQNAVESFIVIHCPEFERDSYNRGYKRMEEKK